MNSTSTEQAADKLPSPALPRRLAALLYDVLLVLPLIMFSAFLLMGLRSLFTGEGAGELGSPALHPTLVQLVAWLTACAFFCSFWGVGGQTLGMQAWRIKLVTTTGEKPGLKPLLLRCIGATLSAACLGLGYLWSLVDRDNRYWHDMLTGTRLVVVPKRKRSDS